MQHKRTHNHGVIPSKKNLLNMQILQAHTNTELGCVNSALFMLCGESKQLLC